MTDKVRTGGDSVRVPHAPLTDCCPDESSRAGFVRKMFDTTAEDYDRTAESIPLPDVAFDFLSMGYALRHIGDLRAVFREFHRVLKPGGKVCLLEITCPETR